MSRKTTLFATLLMATFAMQISTKAQSLSTENGVITTPPEGYKKSYYMDLQTYDNVVGLMGDTHTETSVVFTENGEVYVPNMVYRKSVKGYLRGILNATGDTITFANRQVVGYAPNLKQPYYLEVIDLKGKRTGVSSFRWAIDKATQSIAPVDTSLYLALFVGDDDSGYFGMGANMTYRPKDSVDARLDSYNFSCVNISYDRTNDAISRQKAKGYFDGDTFYVKGLDLKYPQAWLKGTLRDDGVVQFLSRQLVHLSSNDDPVALIAISENAEGNTIYQAGFLLQYDAEKRELTAVDDQNWIANCSVDEEQLQVQQVYKAMQLTYNELHIAQPQNPVFGHYLKESKELKVTLLSKDTKEQALDTDFLFYKIYIDGELHTFTKADNPRMKSEEDIIEMPWIFSDYYTVSGRSEEKYITLNGISEQAKTISVELIYRIKGEVRVSDRLVYDIQEGTTSYITGLAAVIADKSPVEIHYYDLQGKRLFAPKTGMLIRQTRYNDGTICTERILR